MFGFGNDNSNDCYSESRQNRDDVYGNEQHQSHLSHELVGGAAGFEAMKLWEDKQRKNGEPVSHAKAKEALAAAAAFECEKLFETKGLDAIDRQKAKHHAQEHAMEMYDERYGDQDQYNPQQQSMHNSFDY